ncbi:MAG: YdbH domain-containing protein [Rickettsiales bacterium]|nr:YdbH domain-containing protein [Pseudomonadota bacterium]MDA0965943.1 YdbH domain-containing protein [Pseudomonadota bacterium]MDG4542585.1 YdbH domain-containing protein [Rickettsiales bacterium]MDG4545089.1 YdbH domain-containing protein [Rickettsiales bacterium]MDG4547212.1 YdbH domain-containing protein [Rickettsiales bacterium]
MRFLKFLFIAIIVLSGISVTAYFTMPWKIWVAEVVRDKLQAMNIPIGDFKITDVSLTGIKISDLRIDMEPEIFIPDINISYNIKEAANLNFDTIELSSFTYIIRSGDKPSGEQGDIFKKIPSPDIFAKIPFKTIKADEIRIIYKDKKHITANFIIKAEINTESRLLTATLKSGNILANNRSYNIEGAVLSLTTGEQFYIIDAAINKISLDKNERTPVIWLPVSVSAKGSLASSGLELQINAKHKMFAIKGMLVSNNTGTYAKNIKADIAEGSLSVAKLPLDKKNFETKVDINSVSLEKLLKFVLKDDETVKATGNMSGTIPIRKNSKGFSFEGASMYNLTDGILSLSEKHLGALPQNVEQVKNTSDLLKNFMYDDLKLITGQHDGKPEISAKLRGNNPKVYNGAVVNLNINFRGDVIESISSMLGLDDISQYKQNR